MHVQVLAKIEYRVSEVMESQRDKMSGIKKSKSHATLVRTRHKTFWITRLPKKSTRAALCELRSCVHAMRIVCDIVRLYAAGAGACGQRGTGRDSVAEPGQQSQVPHQYLHSRPQQPALGGHQQVTDEMRCVHPTCPLCQAEKTLQRRCGRLRSCRVVMGQKERIVPSVLNAVPPVRAARLS